MGTPLHLFISGYRIAYRVAALNAVCAPIGASQKFTYSEGKNVTAQTKSALSSNVGCAVIITFVDRFAEGSYRYIFVRRARLVKTLVDGGKVEVTIQFDDWPATAPDKDYSKWITETLVPIGAARLVGHAENDSDGEYLLFGPEPTSEFFRSDDGWRALVEKLSETHALGTSAAQTVVFARLEILEEASNRIVSWHRSSSTSQTSGDFTQNSALRLGRANSYRARVDYLFPLQKTDQNAALPYNLTFTAGLEAIDSSMGSVGAYARADEIRFRVAPLSQRSYESVQLNFGPASTDIKGLISPRLEVSIKPRLSPRAYGLLLLIGFAWVVGTGLASQAAAPNAEFHWGFYLGPLVQYLAFVAMFRVFGTKLT
jgi:hypothetical protein